MRTPLIGIPLYRDYYGNPLWSAPIRYVEAIEAAGGECFPLAPFSGQATLANLWEHVDGLLLTGGGDVDPCMYGQAGNGTLKLVDPERDALEQQLVDWAMRDALPVMGICRGIQSLNVAMGGSLVQDIPSMCPTPIVHSMDRALPRWHVQHKVRCQPDSLLADALGVHGEELVEVNSMHHQCVDDVAPGLKVVAWATDGIPEGVELADKSRFVVGVQWHPEEMAPGDSVMRRLFARFVAACDAQG